MERVLVRLLHVLSPVVPEEVVHEHGVGVDWIYTLLLASLPYPFRNHLHCQYGAATDLDLEPVSVLEEGIAFEERLEGSRIAKRSKVEEHLRDSVGDSIIIRQERLMRVSR